MVSKTNSFVVYKKIGIFILGIIVVIPIIIIWFCVFNYKIWIRDAVHFINSTGQDTIAIIKKRYERENK